MDVFRAYQSQSFKWTLKLINSSNGPLQMQSPLTSTCGPPYQELLQAPPHKTDSCQAELNPNE